MDAFTPQLYFGRLHRLPPPRNSKKATRILGIERLLAGVFLDQTSSGIGLPVKFRVKRAPVRGQVEVFAFLLALMGVGVCFG